MDSDELIDLCSRYGSIDWDGIDWVYTRSDYKIETEKWDKLTREQKKSFCDFDGPDEDWYRENALDIWDEVERLADDEESYANGYVIDRLKEKIEEEYKEARDYDEMIRREYYRDKL